MRYLIRAALNVLLAAAAGLILCPSAGAQVPNATNLGPPPVGSSLVLLDAASPPLIYTVSPGGLQASRDGGKTWQFCGSQVRSARLIRATGSAGPDLLVGITPSGPRVSSDRCVAWTDLGSQGIQPSSEHIRDVFPYPDNPQVLYASMDGLGGMYRSTDGGTTWVHSSVGLPSNALVTAITADPGRPEHIIAGVRYNSRSQGKPPVFSSIDGGLTWRSSSLGITTIPTYREGVVGLGWSGARLFVATEHSGLYASDDRGSSWSPVVLPGQSGTGNPPGEAIRTPTPGYISGFMTGSNGLLVLATREGAFYSGDGGKSWHGVSVGGGANDAYRLSLDTAGTTAIVWNRAGIWRFNLPAGTIELPATAATPVRLTPTAPLIATATLTPTATRPRPTATPTLIPTATIVLVAGPKPSDRAEPLDPSFSDYFPQTGHNIKSGFRDYWLANGGLRFFGYPITEEFAERGVAVQYFERVRFEYHGGKVTLGLLGSELTSGQFFLQVPFFPSEDTRAYFGPTKHSVSGPFLTYWRENGGLESFGYPLSESFETAYGEGQWFERARIEWHRSYAEGKRIALGAIGTETLQKRGWIR